MSDLKEEKSSSGILCRLSTSWKWSSLSISSGMTEACTKYALKKVSSWRIFSEFLKITILKSMALLTNKWIYLTSSLHLQKSKSRSDPTVWLFLIMGLLVEAFDSCSPRVELGLTSRDASVSSEHDLGSAVQGQEIGYFVGELFDEVKMTHLVR